MIDTLWWIGQILGVIAIAVTYSALLAKDDKYHRVGTYVGAIIDAAHWFCLFANTAGVMALLIAFRVYYCSLIEEKGLAFKSFITTLFCILFSIAAYITWIDYYSFYPLLSAIIATIGYTFLSGILLRWCLIGCNLPWIIYSIHVDSYPGVLAALIAISLLGVAIIRIKNNG